ncbi:MAG: hypothetical protein IPF92_21995 [Myxococcales bacterium]|jgi:hypothetical protein|nr:hypothetical protein [Myxococcales bacterium]MBL0194513.1 hypothetical protein [Myxococcales bacterium]HQY61284.1 hypothetical protein [Polyangiaceae bacterium]
MTRTRRDVLLAVAVAAAAGLASFAVLRDRGAPAPARAPAPPSATATFFAAPPPEGPRGYGGESEADAHHSIRALATPPERVPVSSARAPSLAGHSPGF